MYPSTVMIMPWAEAYLERCQTSTMELFAKMVNDWKPENVNV